MRPIVILFAKAPIPGRVKTRLQPDVDPVRAAELHSAFVQDMIEMLESLSDVADLELSTDCETEAWSEIRITRSVQAGGDLGDKMYAALAAALATGRPKAMIVGSDAPTLPASFLRTLLASHADVGLGPTEDGGYYAICCRKVVPGMFAAIEWSTHNTLSSTASAVCSHGLSVELGSVWFDIDQATDLERLRGSPGLPPHTKKWFVQYSR